VVLIAAGLALCRNKNQPRTLVRRFRPRGAAKSMQNTDHRGIGRPNAESNRRNDRKAENNRDIERNHVFPPAL
jgi:hypothetical protein